MMCCVEWVGHCASIIHPSIHPSYPQQLLITIIILILTQLIALRYFAGTTHCSFTRWQHQQKVPACSQASSTVLMHGSHGRSLCSTPSCVPRRYTGEVSLIIIAYILSIHPSTHLSIHLDPL